MSVYRCVCFRHTFQQLQQQAQQEGWQSVADISRATQCGTGCSGCVPYLRAMLKTGATHFAVRKGKEEPRPCDPDPWDS